MNPFVLFAGGVSLVTYALYRLFRFERGRPEMADASQLLQEYHDEFVRLPSAAREELFGRREANERRLVAALTDRGGPLPLEFIPQGSMAMRTTILAKDGLYDIDDGVVFDAAVLVGPRGAPLAPRAVRELVRDALVHPAFAAEPEVRTNCVRVYYNQGYHVDVPVYRKSLEGSREVLELAGAEWTRSDPQAVNAWFEKHVTASPMTNKSRQLRKVVRFVKAWARSRRSWNLPKGFTLTILCVECYTPAANRDDVALYETMRRMFERLDDDLSVKHPVLENELATGAERERLRALMSQLEQSLKPLQRLFEDDCTGAEAAKCWLSVLAS